MIITGYAIEEKEGDYRVDFLSNGKEAIKEFHTLSSILNDFRDFEEEKYDSNIFLVLASTSKHDIFCKGPNKESYERLKHYEALLNDIEIKDYKPEKRNAIFKKMNSFDKQQNRSIMLELEFLRQLKQHEKIINVIYDDFLDSNHDYRITLDGIDCNLELTGLGESEPNKILRKSFFKIANELLKFIPTDKMLKIDLKTDTLLNEKKQMDEKYICNLVVQGIKNIRPIILVKNNSYCIINTEMGEFTKNLFDIREIFKYYNDWGERLALLCKTQEGEAYLKDTYLSIFKYFPISSFDFCDAKGKLVEVHSQSVFPSVAENLREKALLKQLERLANEKLKNNQLLGQENPIIIIQFKDILFKGYSNEREMLSGEYLEKIESRILKAFENNREYNNILGIMLFEDFLTNSIFVPNPNISIQIPVLYKLKLISQII
ncbi:MAG: hypothetical protein K8S18_17810 [Desulfobacula sp.]|nr:hypothetical protein [Desulfobacula sp.]